MIISKKENLIKHISSPKCIEIEKIILNMWTLFSRIYATQSRTASRAKWVRKSHEDWYFSDISLLCQNMDGAKCTHNHWFIIAQTYKNGISQVAASEDNTCDQNVKILNLPYLAPSIPPPS